MFFSLGSQSLTITTQCSTQPQPNSVTMPLVQTISTIVWASSKFFCISFLFDYY